MNRKTQVSFERESNTAFRRISDNDDRSYTTLGVTYLIRHILDEMMADENNRALSVTVIFDETLEHIGGQD